MLGKIVSYDPETQTGNIQVNRSLFVFHIDQWSGEDPPAEGDSVEFRQRKNKVIEVRYAGNLLPQGEPVKSKMIAGILGILLGGFGVGRFYLGFYGIGALQLLLTVVTIGFGFIWGFVDGVLILSGNILKDAQGRPLK